MNRFKLKSQFKNNTINVESQLDHKWTNTLKNECKSDVSKTYWPNIHKPIYITFKLSSTLSIYGNKPISYPFIYC
jgi:hypothetical protein